MKRDVRILFVWTGVTSYMTDCWRRLAAVEGVELKVVIENVHSGRAFDAGRVLDGLDSVIVQGGSGEAGRAAALDAFLARWTPDVVFAVGWHSRVVRELVLRPDWRSIPKVCCFDMPWRWSVRCIAARWVLHPFIRHYSAAYVPGRLCARYAKWLGFPFVEKGLFSIDGAKLRAAATGGPREGFLYVGRYSSEKRVDLVESAYQRYRELGGTWALDCYGQGGRFAQPDEMPAIYASHACLLLASAFDPWPLVALEARTAGCDVIMSDRCGNRFELPGAVVVKFGDVESMAQAMVEIESRKGADGGMAMEGALAKYDCGAWAERTLGLAAELTKGGQGA